MSAVSIDWGAFEIFIARSGLTLVQTVPLEIREMDINWFRLQLKDLEDSIEGMPFPDTHRHNTEVTLAGLTFARVVEILDPYTITFEDGQYAVNLVGANSNIGDKVNVNYVSVRSNNSAGLISTPLIEFSSFDGGIWYDEENGTTGTIFPIGTKLRPAKLLSDVKTIADYRGFNVVYVIGDANINTGIDFTRFVFEGQTHVNNIANVFPSANVTNAVFRNLTLTGTLDGGNEVTNCIVSGLTYVNGHIHNCGLIGNIELDGNKDAIVADCKTIDPTNPPIINMGGSGQNLAMPNYSGLLKLTNMTGSTDFAGIGLLGGEIVLDNTITNGIVHVSGIGKLVDNNGDEILTGIWNGGVTVINELMNRDNISDTILNRDISSYIQSKSVAESLKFQAYSEMVTIDVSGVTGTTYDIGSKRNPVNNLADAITIASNLGFTVFNFTSNFTFPNGTYLLGYELRGQGSNATTLTFEIGSIVAYCTIRAAKATGRLTGVIGFNDVNIFDLGSVGLVPSSQSILINKSLFQGETILPDNYSGDITILDSWAIDDIDENEFTIFNNGNSVSNMNIRNFAGNIKFTNVTKGNEIDITLTGGKIILDNNTFTSGMTKITGIGLLVDNNDNEILTGIWNSGVTIVNNLINRDNISDTVLNTSLTGYTIPNTVATSLQLSAYEDAVWIDASSGNTRTGTIYPYGTIENPVNNLNDALIIANQIGFKRLEFLSDYTFDSLVSIEMFELHGRGFETTTLTFEYGCILSLCKVYDVKITGQFIGITGMFNSHIKNVEGLNLYPTVLPLTVEHCLLEGDIKIASGYTSIITILDSWGVPDSVTKLIPILNMSNGDFDLHFSNYSGSIKIINCSENIEATIYLNSGSAVLDNSVTNGTFVFAGIGTLINNSINTTVDTDALISKQIIAESVWDEDLSNHVISGTTGKVQAISQFGGVVFVNSGSTTTGTTFPAGTERSPVNNVNDAIAIASDNGFNRIVFLSDYFFPDGTFIQNYELIGKGYLGTLFTFETITGGCVVLGCTFENATLTGNFTGVKNMLNCKLKDLGSIGLAPSNQEILVKNCFFDGMISLPSNYSGKITIVDSYSNVVGSATPTMNLGNSTADIQYRNYTGGMKIINVTQGNVMSVDLLSGQVKLDPATVTSAVIVVRGNGKIINADTNEYIYSGIWNSGVTVLSEANTPSQTAKETWDENLFNHVTDGTTGRILSLTAFNNIIWMDSHIGVTGQTFPIGTQGKPSSYGADALAIALRENITEFRFNGEFTSTQNMTGYTIGGDTWLNDKFIINGTNYDDLTFKDLYVTGTMGSLGDKIEYKNCYIKDIDNLSGEMIGCRISGLIKVGGGKTLSGVGIVSEGDFTVIDLQGVSGTTVSLDISSGLITIINCVEGCLIEFNFNGGEIELDSSCTGGDFYIEGIGTLYGDPEALGMNIVGNNLIDNDTISSSVWNKTLP